MAVLILLVGMAVSVSVMTATTAQANDGCSSVYFPMGIRDGANYLDDYGGGSGTYVHTYPYTGSKNQLWCPEFASQGGIYLHPMNNLGLCLDAHTDNAGQQIWVYSCNGSAPQRWCWASSTTTPTYIVRSTNSGAALNDNCIYCIVTLVHGGANTWLATRSSIQGAC